MQSCAGLRAEQVVPNCGLAPEQALLVYGG